MPEITAATYRALLRSPIRSFCAAVVVVPARQAGRGRRAARAEAYFALVQGAAPPCPEQKAVACHLARLNVDPAAAVLIGDLRDDARAAQQAGVSVVLYCGGFGAPASIRL